METPEEKFLRIAVPRAQKMLDAFNLFLKTVEMGPKVYEIEPNEWVKIETGLHEGLSRFDALTQTSEAPVETKAEEPQPEEEIETPLEVDPEERSYIAWIYDDLRAGRTKEAKGKAKAYLEKHRI